MLIARRGLHQLSDPCYMMPFIKMSCIRLLSPNHQIQMRNKSPLFNSNLKKQRIIPHYDFNNVLKRFPQTNQRMFKSWIELLSSVQSYASAILECRQQSKPETHTDVASCLGAKPSEYISPTHESEQDDEFTLNIIPIKKKPLTEEDIHDKSTRRPGSHNQGMLRVPSNKIVVLPTNVKGKRSLTLHNAQDDLAHKCPQTGNQNIDKNLAIWDSHRKKDEEDYHTPIPPFSFTFQPKMEEDEELVDECLSEDNGVSVADEIRKTLNGVKQKETQTQIKKQLIVIEISDDENDQNSNANFFPPLSTSHLQINNSEAQPKTQGEQDRSSSRSSSYSMTSYSSNSSSNNKPHNIMQVWQEFDENGKPILPVNLFLKKTDSFCGMYPQLNLSKNFKPSLNLNLNPSIANTPKKSNKKKKRRLYCREKKIPSWAQDLQTVAGINKTIDPKKVFGVCFIHNLNTEYIFKDYYKKGLLKERFSNMKWEYESLKGKSKKPTTKKKNLTMPVIVEREHGSDASNQ